MPYSPQHKQQTKENITEVARVLFNRHGFDAVSIDAVMQAAGLTRGGFYNHFTSKEALYEAAVASFLMGRGAQWRADAGIDTSQSGTTTPDDPDSVTALMVRSYLSSEHLGDLDGQCPMIALPSDIARAGPELKSAYQQLLQAMVGLFEQDINHQQADGAQQPDARSRALAMASLCIGGMVVARTLPDSKLADEVRAAALASVETLAAASTNPD